mmetsp:Transcript_3858/g.5159  ORF Transcript_3858/g.5159 Transcript_3858/m.5159 type:complete len:117 (-) Transcript_3858:226-576(-)
MDDDQNYNAELTPEEPAMLYNIKKPAPNNNNAVQLPEELQHESAVLTLPSRVVKLSTTHPKIPLVFLKIPLGKISQAVEGLRASRPSGNPPVSQPPLEPPESESLSLRCSLAPSNR